MSQIDKLYEMMRRGDTLPEPLKAGYFLALSEMAGCAVEESHEKLRQFIRTMPGNKDNARVI